MIQFHELPACARYYRQPALDNAVGLIPTCLSEDDPRPAREQFDTYYAGGWSPFDGFELSLDSIPKLKYPGDPSMPPLAYAWLRDEMIVVYPSSWVMILQRHGGSHEIARMD